MAADAAELRPAGTRSLGSLGAALSHWSGDVAQMSPSPTGPTAAITTSAPTYLGKPVHGFRSTSAGVPLDTFGRNVYLDTLNSGYGKGWRRENSFLVHKPTGKFCYGFYSHGGRPPGAGQRYRATVIGPGVTPDVYWEARRSAPRQGVRPPAARRAEGVLRRRPTLPPRLTTVQDRPRGRRRRASRGDAPPPAGVSVVTVDLDGERLG